MKKSKNRAFTLAEVMIVLTVIGVLSAILLPVAFHSTPDKNILKFKKANNTFYSAIRELVSSGKYYMPGYLGIMPDGTLPIGITIETNSGYFLDNYYLRKIASWASHASDDGIQYFCNSFADLVSAKENNCTFDALDTTHTLLIAQIPAYYYDKIETISDTYCLPTSTIFTKGYNSFKTNDDVTFYDYGNVFGRASASCTYSKTDEFGYEMCTDKNGFDVSYQIVCMDIDGVDGPIKPFGYGVRSDGKIVSGLRARWWLQRDITKKETDCCPVNLNTNGFCDTNDTICAE